ncbi:MAG: hypothetical protein A3C04_04285 [Candidatus Wildermuthbacteria bacterium RIFCSPHIGHO2_02_FULL_45_25]|uniref:Uncharacterized protein n=1 Tax=Candidatus Wildermuthbacteria bacterium RIFCSPHIGHO2_02_FULL_45_25 TaxID=1802450 RepID=A0A1G2R616_9BACT|nr:MAG: hypothetical protein A3C04_04285 [Candidatus Wildermuthbacteria bacterium RIFCSPHIGHO2_02_FULL_45_25]
MADQIKAKNPRDWETENDVPAELRDVAKKRLEAMGVFASSREVMKMAVVIHNDRARAQAAMNGRK